MEQDRKPPSSAGQTLQRQTMGHSEVTHRPKPQPRSRASEGADKGDWGDREPMPGIGNASTGTK
ncbi:hypothetical protein [Oxalicibacterium solurbis]|uniref:Uncharacterized protein n=1 Tax=Oxalicibacterium solurbis TaxID=69280 RepID=A0A8J3AZ21_9BURK|nr:hypothetical protein [Oxalicibacterium solurbis]GGI55522.1 hypothetical protein GCM10011430_26960 [Oxalicibacterium solurbis]